MTKLSMVVCVFSLLWVSPPFNNIIVAGDAIVDIGSAEAGGPAPSLHLSGDLAFGSVAVATTATRTLTISNFGTEDLTVSGIVYPFGFTGVWSGTIPAGGSQAVTVTFSPDLPRTYGGDVIVDANHTSGSNTISASGEGVCRPVMTQVHHMAPPEGSSGNITITSPPVCAWTAAAVTNWLVLTGADFGQGNGATAFAAMPNPGETSRTGYIRVGSQLVTVIQAGSESSILWWQHQTTGDLGAWVMDGTTQVAGISYGRVTDMLWKIAASGDFNGDGHTDVVWQHYGSGKLAVWLMNGTTVISGQPLTPEVVQFLNWKIRAVADFNGDGRSDLVWQHITDGRVALWFMNGSTLVDSMEIATLDDLGWRIADAADMNGDGKADLVWQHDDTRLATWLMDGSELLSAFLLTPESAAPADWKLRATVDFDGDQKPDLVWQNEADGRIATWLMDGSVMRSAILLTPGAVEDTGWRIVGAKKP